MRKCSDNPWKQTTAGLFLLLTLGGLTDIAKADPVISMKLRAAINDGRQQEAMRLIDEGADVNARTSGGYTPLMIAAGVGDEAMVRLLLARGADPSLVNDSGWTASYIAEINQHRHIQELLKGAATTTVAARVDATRGPSRQSKTISAAGNDSHGWPKLGAYPPGHTVIYSGSAGKTWNRGTVKNIDPTYGYNFEDVSGSVDAYQVVGASREPFWTDWFVGDWNISVPMAMNVYAAGGDLYRVVDGGMRLPPLRINQDGTYTWRYFGSAGETLLRGRWQPNPDGPGVILKAAAHGADWLVYNNTMSSSALGHTVIVSSDKHTHYDGKRIK